MGVEAGDFSRDPSDYEVTDHLMGQLKYERKALTTEMCAKAIEEGEVSDALVSDKGNLCVELLHEWGALSYEVVIDVDNRKVMTACERGR